MFIRSTPFTTISEKAEEDLRGFFLDCTKPKVLKSLKSDPNLESMRHWDRECKKVFDKINAKLKREGQKNTLPTYKDALQLFDDLLPWLEDRKAKLEWPWIKGPDVREIDDEDISYLLKLFEKTFLDGLCMPAQKSYTLADNWLLKKFLEYVGENKKLDYIKWKIVPASIDPEAGPIVAHFLSWLVVDDTHKILYIVRNKDAIYSGTKDKQKIISRLETIFLHELGHAVNHLEWFKEKLKIYKQKLRKYGPEDQLWFLGGRWIGAPAWHEFEAWAYAFAVRSWVKSTRSWIKRLVLELDDEYSNL
jgi:hypothetical protein